MSNEATERIYNEQQNNPQIIHKEVYNHTRNVLHRAVDKVYGQPKYTDDEFQKAFELKQNLSRFAGFKSAWQSKELAEARSADQAHAINNTYNSNWLRTEYVHAVRSSRGAKRWGQMQADKDLYPFLQYMPSTSAEPRSDHRRMYGVIKHLDDSFWDRWFPPNDWGCKCGTAPARNDANSRPMPDDIKPPVKAMRNNPGKSGQIITDDHAMIKNVSAKGKERIVAEGGYLDRRITRNELASIETGVEIKIGDKLAYFPPAAMKKTMSDINQIDWFALKQLGGLRYTAHAVRKPPVERRVNILRTHFHKVENKELYAVVWEMKGKGGISAGFVFHGFTYKITGEKE